ncbi:MAG: hypothetical protein ACRCVW_01685 [Brevinema sp.]
MQQNPILSIITAILGIWLLIYFWLPIFFIVILVVSMYLFIIFLLSLFTQNKPNIKFIKIRSYQSKSNNKQDPDIIETTTADKDKKK